PAAEVPNKKAPDQSPGLLQLVSRPAIRIGSSSRPRQVPRQTLRLHHHQLTGLQRNYLHTSGLRSYSGGDSGPWAYTQCRTSVGFPFTALRHIEQEGDASQTAISQHPLLGCTITFTQNFITISNLAPRGTIFSSALRLPRSIFLPGLIGNCIFWCGTLVLLYRLVRQFRQSRRRTKGLCPACGFDLAHLPRCPECGTPATPAQPASNAPECPAPPPS
ncbi:MAG: hypothetical protein NTV94_04220, partial [Planctomycetota bacterium]|nr:hypothetical protein [Planctomycetota bacterium]